MKSAVAVFAALSALLIFTACGQRSAATTSPVDVDIAVRVEPEPLYVGETTLIVTLTNGSASPVDGARLQVHGDMDHEGMTSVDREVSESSSGEYRVPFEWTMGGGWRVTVTAHMPDGGEISKTFDFFVEAVSSESIINRHNALSSAPINIAYQPDNDPAISGDATVTITLTDGDDNPVTDAIVEIVGDMAHAGMMPISGVGEHQENGQYVVPLRWTMAGDWQVTVEVTLTDGRQLRQTFDQQVTMP